MAHRVTDPFGKRPEKHFLQKTERKFINEGLIFMKRTLTVDTRMLKSAGIGTYLRSLLPRLMQKAPEWRFVLIGRREEMESFSWARSPQATLIHSSRPIYAPGEQW